MSACTLLLVADRGWTDHLQQTLFARRNMRVVLAESLAEAQQKARFAPPDMVICKRALPDGSADDLCRWCRNQGDLRHVRFIAMLDSENLAEARKARVAGADQVILKPESPDSLTPLVAQLLEAPLRQDVRVPVEVRVEGETSAGTLSGLTRNISASGAFIEIAGTEVKVGDHLYVRLHLSGSPRPVVAKAEAMRVKRDTVATGIGVRFLRFDKDGQEVLDRYLRQTI